MKIINNTHQFLLAAICCITLACQKQPIEDAKTDPSTPPVPTTDQTNSARYLYVATGQCYSGNAITTFTAATSSNLLIRINTTTGNRDSIIADYNAAPASAGDTPVSVVNWDANYLLALIGNGTSGRIEMVPKTGGLRSNFGLNPGPGTTLASTVRGMVKTFDGGLLILRTGIIEKVNASGLRVGAPWVNNALQAACGTGNTFYTSVSTSATTSNRIIATHAAASQNRIVSLAASGANNTSGCSAAQAAPAVSGGNAAFPVASVFDHNSGKLLVAYAANNAVAEANSIYAYNFDENTGAISSPQKIYDASQYPGTYSHLLYGISAMTLDEQTNTLYVATAISNSATVTNYAIEKFSFDASKIGTANSAVLTRVGSTPFYNYGIDTKCISSMVVGN